MAKELSWKDDERFPLFVLIAGFTFTWGLMTISLLFKDAAAWAPVIGILVLLTIITLGTLIIERLGAFIPRQKQMPIAFTILSLIIGYFIVASNSSPTMPDYSNSSSTSSGGSWENGGKGKRINGAIPEFAECANKLNGQFSSVKKATEYCCRQIGGTMGGTYGGNCYK